MQEHWTNFILTTPKPIFLQAHPTGEAKQNAENIAIDIENVIQTIDINKLSAIITDNAPVMKKAWRILKKKYPNVIFLGCIAHNINLIINDITKLDWIKKIMNDSKKIVKYFKSHNIATGILKRYQKRDNTPTTSLKLPCKTRWGSSATCLESLIRNQLALELTITELTHDLEIQLSREIKDIVNDGAYWSNVNLVYNILNKLALGIKFFESDDIRLSYFYSWYQNLLSSGNYYSN